MNDTFSAALEEVGYDVTDFVEIYREELYELFETGSCALKINSKDFLLKIEIQGAIKCLE